MENNFDRIKNRMIQWIVQITRMDRVNNKDAITIIMDRASDKVM